MKSRTLSSLPSLPVPDLRESLEQLKSSAGPHALNPEEFTEFLNVVDDFSHTTGPKLHQLLKNKSRKTVNWLSHDWWQDKAYLQGRDPLILWSNPGLVCPRISLPSDKNVTIKYISHLVLGALDFKLMLSRGENPEPGSQNVCMDQYTKVFGTTRIPGATSDQIRFGSLQNPDQMHRVVFSRNGNFFRISLPQNSTKENYAFLNQGLSAILFDENYSDTSHSGLGALTALPRTDWAHAFTRLNPNSISAILESDFVVSLDHVSDEREYERNWSEKMGRQVLLADSENIGNRWFDKTVQMIVVLNRSGEQVIGSGLCYEHTPAEGPPIVRLMEHCMKYVARESGSKDWPALSTEFSPPTSGHTLTPLPFDIESDSTLKKAVTHALKHHSDLSESLDIRVLNFTEFGKRQIKEWKFSPDSFIQVAICWAYFRLHRTIGACYESASTRQFALGRTECIRSVTPGFFELTRNPDLNALRNAIADHKNTVKQAMNGKGIDRLLLGMNAAAHEVHDNTWQWGLESESGDQITVTDEDLKTLNRLYRNELFIRSKYFKLSTSQVATIFPESFMVYGPLVTDGYGCCYNPSDKQLTFGISCFNQKQIEQSVSNADQFKDSLQDTLCHMRDMICSGGSKL